MDPWLIPYNQIFIYAASVSYVVQKMDCFSLTPYKYNNIYIHIYPCI